MTKEVFIQNLDEACLCVQQEWQEAIQGNNSRNEKVLLVIMDELHKMKIFLDCRVFSHIIQDILSMNGLIRMN